MASPSTLTPRERAAIEGLRAFLEARFGARLRELSLFGSVARGERREDSDVDILVVIDDLSSSERREVGWCAGDLLTEHDVLLAPLAMSTARRRELRDRERLLGRELDRDGVPL